MCCHSGEHLLGFEAIRLTLHHPPRGWEMRFFSLVKRIDVIEEKLDWIDKMTKGEIVALGDEIYQIKLRTKKLEQKIAKPKN